VTAVIGRDFKALPLVNFNVKFDRGPYVYYGSGRRMRPDAPMRCVLQTSEECFEEGCLSNVVLSNDNIDSRCECGLAANFREALVVLNKESDYSHLRPGESQIDASPLA